MSRTKRQSTHGFWCWQRVTAVVIWAVCLVGMGFEVWRQFR